MLDLPDFPWDSLTKAREHAAAYPDGIIDLSIGSPVDDVAPGIQLALAEAAAAPGYPSTEGTDVLRDAIVTASQRRFGYEAPAVLPVVGTKEAIAFMPLFLGADSAWTIGIPELAYPTYDVAARIAGATSQRTETADLVFLNSPCNPTGEVLGVERLRGIVHSARERGAIVVSDECYLGLGWDDDNPPVSLLHDSVTDGDLTGLIAVNSLSKTSNMASYRAGWLAGDPDLIDRLTLARKHAGLSVPGPIQSAMVAALEDDIHERLQRLTYANRRVLLMEALTNAGFQIDHSEAGMYIWATRGEEAAESVRWLAERGVLVAPGTFYGPTGEKHIRAALSAPDEAFAQLAARLG